MIDKNIKFHERIDNEDHGTTTLYFIAPNEYFNNEFPDVKNYELNIEFPFENPKSNCAKAKVSAAIEDGEDIDYFWEDIILPDDKIDELIKMGLDSAKSDMEYIFIIKDKDGYISSITLGLNPYETQEQALYYAYEYLKHKNISKANININQRRKGKNEEWTTVNTVDILQPDK